MRENGDANDLDIVYFIHKYERFVVNFHTRARDFKMTEDHYSKFLDVIFLLRTYLTPKSSLDVDPSSWVAHLGLSGVPEESVDDVAEFLDEFASGVAPLIWMHGILASDEGREKYMHKFNMDSSQYERFLEATEELKTSTLGEVIQLERVVLLALTDAPGS